MLTYALLAFPTYTMWHPLPGEEATHNGWLFLLQRTESRQSPTDMTSSHIDHVYHLSLLFPSQVSPDCIKLTIQTNHHMFLFPKRSL